MMFKSKFESGGGGGVESDTPNSRRQMAPLAVAVGTNSSLATMTATSGAAAASPQPMSLSPSIGTQLSRSSSKSSIGAASSSGSIGLGNSALNVNNEDESTAEKLFKLNAWVPPNDRELTIRAKLKTGWSSRTSAVAASAIQNQQSSKENRFKLDNVNLRSSNKLGNALHQHQARSASASGVSSPHALGTNNNATNSSNSFQPQISDSEFYEIEQVLKRASAIEHKELDRVSRLYQRYNSMNKPQGNGDTTCFICNCNFGILSATPRICNDCLRNVCPTCSIDSLSTNKQSTIWLCRICAEYRDLLKKSGAWFSKRVPNVPNSTGVTPSNSNLSSIHSNSIKSDEIKLTQSNPLKSAQKMDEFAVKNEKKELRAMNSNREDTDSEDEDQDGLKNPFAAEIKSKNSSISLNKSDLEDSTSTHSSNLATHDNADSQIQNQQNQQQQQHHESLSPIIEMSHFDNNNNKTFGATSHGGDKMLNVNDIMDPMMDSKLIQEQIAKSKPMTLTNLANSTTISASNLTSTQQIANNGGSKATAAGNNANLSKTSTLSSDSISNLSMAFQSYKPTKPPPNTQLGKIQFAVEYIPSQLQLKIDLISATDLPARDSNGFSDPYVKIHLLPGIAKATKLRSKTTYKNLNPLFNESFHYDGVTVQDLDLKTLRLTVLDEDKFGFDFIGEYRLPLKTLIRNEINHFNVSLEEKLENDDECDLTIRGKINFALKYSKQTNCLYVKINRCTQLLPMDNGKSSDPFVQISLLPFSKENKQRFKTKVKPKTLDPEFFEEFKFTNVELRSLLTKTIEIAVWDKDFRKNDFIGLVQLGQDRSGEELKHFFTMIKNPELYHEQWHTLHLKGSIGASVDSL